MKYFIILAAASISLAACTTTGNTEKEIAAGASAGAATGAVLGNNLGAGDAATGAAVGALVGAVSGAVSGHKDDQLIGEPTEKRHSAEGQRLFFDQNKERYYYIDPTTGRTYWQDGSLRSIPPG